MPIHQSLSESEALLLQSGLSLIMRGDRRPDLLDAADRRSVRHSVAYRIWTTEQGWLNHLMGWVLNHTWVQGHETTRINDVTQTNQLMMMASFILAAGDPSLAHFIDERIDELDQRTHDPEVTNRIVGQAIRQNAVAAARQAHSNQDGHEQAVNKRPVPAVRTAQTRVRDTCSCTARADHQPRPTILDSLRV